MNDLSILQMEVSLNSETYSMDLSEDMVINVADINESYCDQPSKFAWWATLATLSRSKANKLKQLIDKESDYIKTTLSGVLDAKIRKEMELNGEKITEGKVQNAIYTDHEYISHKDRLFSLQEEFVVADEQARLLEVGKETMNQRKEMLISLGAQLRTDYDGVSDFISKKQDDSKIAEMKSIVGKRKAIRREPVVSKESEE